MITGPFATEPAGLSRADLDRYAARLHDAAHEPGCDCRPQIRRQFRNYVTAVVTWLAADGHITSGSNAEATR